MNLLIKVLLLYDRYHRIWVSGYRIAHNKQNTKNLIQRYKPCAGIERKGTTRREIYDDIQQANPALHDFCHYLPSPLQLYVHHNAGLFMLLDIQYVLLHT